MKKLENKCMLITYADSIGNDLKDLEYALETYFKDAVKGVHILPFFHHPEIGALRPLIIPAWTKPLVTGVTLSGCLKNII